MTTSRSTEFLNIQNIFFKLPHCKILLGDIHKSSHPQRPDLWGNTSGPAFRWIALLLSRQARKLTEGSSIAPAPYSRGGKNPRGVSWVVEVVGDSFPNLKKQQTQAPISCTCDHFGWTWQSGEFKLLHLSKVRDTPKNDDVKGVRVRKKICFSSDVCRKGSP